MRCPEWSVRTIRLSTSRRGPAELMWSGHVACYVPLIQGAESQMGSTRFRPSSRDRGAAAVEFALVVPILLALMVGIVDYGLWFGDSLNARQGVDEGARQAVVKNFD